MSNKPNNSLELTRIVHSQLWSEEDRPINEVDEHVMFDVMIDAVRQAGIFAEIELSLEHNVRWIRVHSKDANKAKSLINEADNRGVLQDMVNARTDWE